MRIKILREINKRKISNPGLPIAVLVVVDGVVVVVIVVNGAVVVVDGLDMRNGEEIQELLRPPSLNVTI